MKQILCYFALCVLAFSVAAQKRQAGAIKFDNAEFSKKFEVVEWLVEYDNVAWKSTDFLMTQDKADIARLGSEWFCFQDSKKVWHAVYGRFENQKYEAVFHFTMDAAGKISKSNDKLDGNFLNLHAKALITARTRLSSNIPEGSPRFNQYVRLNTDKTLSVWMLPAFQTDGTAVYGGEGVYTIDPTGSKIVKDESYFQENFRGFATGNPREIWLKYNEIDKPTLGAIFFVWYYKPYFTKIYIDTSKSMSTVVNNGGAGFVWLHVEKDGEVPVKSSK